MSKNFLKLYKKNGFCIVKGEKKILGQIKKKTVNHIKNFLKKNNIKSSLSSLENLHNIVPVEILNKLRLHVYNNLNDSSFSRNYYKISKKYLDEIVGNELAMQKKINFSIQLPKDESSILPVHSDTWAGDSPFEVVVWIPLVNANKTSSMFILPKYTYREKKFTKINFKNNEQIRSKFKKDFKFINIKYAQILIFNQSLPHGNDVNMEKNTRVSFNCRFKSLFSPYDQKKLIEFFNPLNLKPATLDGINYNEPNFN